MRPQDHIPASWRLAVQLARRQWRDRRSGLSKTFAQPQLESINLPAQLSLELEVKRTSTYTEKMHNFRTANRQIERTLVDPGQVFSFWQAVGAPSRSRGYQEGRTLIGGVLKPTVGGGLCQLAGMLYYLGLIAGLEVVERHPHSVDIYTEESRYTPLGSDATVVYGYKDLRLRNPHAQPIGFRFEPGDGVLQLHLLGKSPLISHPVEFRRIVFSASEAKVETWVDQRLLNCAIYSRQGS